MSVAIRFDILPDVEYCRAFYPSYRNLTIGSILFVEACSSELCFAGIIQPRNTKYRRTVNHRLDTCIQQEQHKSQEIMSGLELGKLG